MLLKCGIMTAHSSSIYTEETCDYGSLTQFIRTSPTLSVVPSGSLWSRKAATSSVVNKYTDTTLNNVYMGHSTRIMIHKLLDYSSTSIHSVTLKMHQFVLDQGSTPDPLRNSWWFPYSSAGRLRKIPPPHYHPSTPAYCSWRLVLSPVSLYLPARARYD